MGGSGSFSFHFDSPYLHSLSPRGIIFRGENKHSTTSLTSLTKLNPLHDYITTITILSPTHSLHSSPLPLSMPKIPTNGSFNASQEETRQVASSEVNSPEINASMSLYALASHLLDRASFQARAGFSSHDGARNLFDALGFKHSLTIKDYRDAYSRGGIAKRIVDFFPAETWRGGVFLVENEDPDTVTPFESQWEEFRDRLSLAKVFRRADRLARLGEYSVILLGTSRAGDLSTRLPRGSSPDQIIHLAVYAQDRADIKTYITDPTDPRWGLPESYTLRVDQDGRGATRSLTVHWSRVIHACHDSLDSDTCAPPMLQAPYNDLTSLWKLTWGGAEVSWRRARQLLHANLDADATKFNFDKDYIKDLKDKIIELQHGFDDTIITRGTDLSMLSAPVDKFDANGNFLLDLIGGTVQIQKRNLLGSEKVGELASALDRKRNADVITSMQEGFAEPLVRELVTRLIDYGYFSPPMKKSKGRYEVVFSLEEELSEDEKAEYAAKMAAANKDQAQAEGKILRTSDELRDYLWEAEPLEEPEESVADPDTEETDIDNPGEEVSPLDPGEVENGGRQSPTVNQGVEEKAGAKVGPVSKLKAAKLRLQKKREKIGR